MSKSIRYSVGLLSILLLSVVVLSVPSAVQGGIYNSSSEVTYKEYWIDHDQFTGGCAGDGRSIEPFDGKNGCTHEMEFTLPDDFSSAPKVEIYLDLWRNRDNPQSYFSINGGDEYHPNVGSDWSRTPWVSEIDMSDLKLGKNKILFWGDKQHKVFDVAFRIYYDDANPLVAGNGNDVTPPEGSLTGIEDDNGVKLPGDGGTLEVNGDELILTATVDGDTKYVEFHAWYEGYDENNDGNFRDWHNLIRNNWCPGGKEVDENPLGSSSTSCTIDHIGSVKPVGTTATTTWEMEHITNQAKIKFKIRLIDAEGNVREAAGGESSSFKLMRDKAATAFVIYDFEDEGLHMEGQRPDTRDYRFDLPATAPDFDKAYLIGNYWKNPRFSLNQSTNSSLANTGDSWELGIKSFSPSQLEPGRNRITYIFTGKIGAFIEYPGPMFVLRQTGAGADNKAPYVHDQMPASGEVDVFYETKVVAFVADEGFGVDYGTITMSVKGVDVTNKVKIKGVMGDYQLVYDPQGLPFDTTIPVEIYACDLKGNCDTSNYNFKTAPPDTTGPVISDIQVSPRPDGGVVSWTTDEPADSKVEFGTSNAYGDSVTDDTLKTSHQLILSGMPAETTVHYKITSEDDQGNDTSTSDDTFKTGAPAQIVSDDFNACQLDPTVWEFVDTVGDATLFMNGEQAELSIPGGKNHDWNGGKIPPRIMQFANDGDFSIEAKFDSPIDQITQMQGLIVEADDDDYMRATFEYTAAKGLIIFAEFVKDGTRIKGSIKDIDPDLTGPLSVKITRAGNDWTWFYWDGENWKAAAQSYTFELSVLRVGFFAGNTSKTAGLEPAHTAVVDNFFNSADPINPEDGTPIALHLTTDGQGTASKTPDQPKYICGDEVTVSASTTALGWEFSHWAGDLTSSNSNETVTMDSAKQITAIFTPIPYDLNINIINNGTGTPANMVTRNPDKPTYIYDDVVQLTAVAAPGWTFNQWGGALTGTDLNKQITMQKSETVSASFDQEQYTLDFEVIHDGTGTGGTATYTPKKATYVYGEVIKLKAVPKVGWTFTGWSGSVDSTDLEKDYTITGNTSIKATFEEDHYDLKVELISDGIGIGGVVIKDPDQSDYLYDTTVTLEAIANPGWEFMEWGGDLSGQNPIQFVDMKSDVNVTAKFFQETYDLTVEIQGPGNVKVDPDKSKFVYGENAKLTAAPASGKFLCKWTGDLTGGENPAVITIVDDMTITAMFGDSEPPFMKPLSDHDILVGEAVAFTITTQGTDPLTIEAIGLPAGAKLKDNGDGTASFSWRPDVTQQGEYPILFTVSDGTCEGGSTSVVTVGGVGVLMPVVVGN